MTFRIFLASLLVLGSAALMAHLAHAGTPAETTSAAVPNDCALADAEVTSRLQPAMTDSRHLPVGMSLGDALASLYKARAFCRGGAPAQGMLVYIRLSDALADPTAVKRR
jgi:hypothetical protein